MRRLAALVLAGAALSGCGAASADLFAVERSGRDRNANVRLVVNDGGTVTCNRGKPRELGADRLLTARELARELEPQAQLDLELPREPDAILSYTVRLAAGRVMFSDTSPRLPASFQRLEAFAADVAENVCHLKRYG